MTVGSGKERKPWIDRLKYAFGIGYEEPELSDADKSALMRVADLIAARRLEVPAIMALESLRPLNFLGSQVMVTIRPFVGFVTDETFFVLVQEALEKRSSVEFLIEYIEDRMNERKSKELSAVKGAGSDK